MRLSYLEAKEKMINALLRSVEAHENGRFGEIEDSYNILDIELPRNAGPEFNKLFVALSFWDGWIDARNHDWKFYEGIRVEDWPRLARVVVTDLQADREITNELVRKHFDFRNYAKHTSIFRRLIQTLLGKL